MHNAQLSKYSDYKIRQAKKLKDSYEELFEELIVTQKIDNTCNIESCEIVKSLKSNIQFHDTTHNIFVEETIYEEIQEKMYEYEYESLFDLFVDALDALHKVKSSCNSSS